MSNKKLKTSFEVRGYKIICTEGSTKQVINLKNEKSMTKNPDLTKRAMNFLKETAIGPM